MARQLEFWEDEDSAVQPATVPAPVPVPVLEGAKKETPCAPAIDPAAVDRLRRDLSERSGMHVLLKITSHTHSLMRVEHEPGGLSARLNLHWVFLDAPQTIVQAIAAWVRNPRKLRRNSLLRGYMRDNTARIPETRRRRVAITTKGKQYDLDELYDEVNAAEFDGRVNAQITWGVMQPVAVGRSRHFRLGSYCERKNLIRIHPVLDYAEVPRFVVRSIVFHEMLHACLGVEKGGDGRRKIHHAAFRERERQYPGHEAAEAWINDEKNMRLLAKIRRCGGLYFPFLHGDA